MFDISFQDMATHFQTPRNLYERFIETVRLHPHKLALVETICDQEGRGFRTESVTFQEFHKLVSSQRMSLEEKGFRMGSRVLVVLAPSLRMYALVSAMFANGVIPVFIDPTMARTEYLRAMKQFPLDGVIAAPELLKYWLWIPGLRRPPKYSLDRSGWGYSKWSDFTQVDRDPALPSLPSDATGLITFTSGSTGVPKAADRTNDILYAQREISKSLWTADKNDVELTAFPMVVLSNLVYGITTVLPPFHRKLSDDLWTEYTHNLIKTFQVTRMALSPFHLNQLSGGAREATTLVQALVVGGAQVPNWLIKKACIRFPNALGHVVYGSTEAEPISHASFSETLKKDAHNGYFVGRRIADIQVRLKEGEIELNGPHVIKRYLLNHSENEHVKVRDQNDCVWHKTRDVGLLDADDAIWLHGRRQDGIEVENQKYFPFPIEHPIENLLERRVAFVKDKSKRPQLIVEHESNVLSADLDSKIRDRLPDSLRLIPLFGTKKIPVDNRHHWRINRELLKTAPP